jgi:hypothetical protein
MSSDKVQFLLGTIIQSLMMAVSKSIEGICIYLSFVSAALSFPSEVFALNRARG